MAEVYPIDPTNFELQSYKVKDENLISQFDVGNSLSDSSYIEFFVYDLNQTLLKTQYNYQNYTVENDGQSAGNNNNLSQIIISPKDDITQNGYSNGSFVAYYNFFTQELGNPFLTYYIKEISSDRTEIRLDSSIFSPEEITTSTNNFIQKRENSEYFLDFFLNFGDNKLTIANNIKLEDENTNNPTVIVKLYEPLPTTLNIKDPLWVVTTINEPEAFQVDDSPLPLSISDSTQISGPNFNLPIKGQINNSSQNLSYNDIISSAPSSSQDQINSLLEESSISISVDYTDFNNFIHFSSVQTRVENFNYKVGLIEGYSGSISSLSNVTSSNPSKLISQKKISNIIKNFDKFEYFMYYNSGSSASWPKTTSTPPYLLAKTTSSAALTWLGSANESSVYFGGTLLSASNFDNANPDELKKSIPEYLREDSDNIFYDLFVDMVAQYYDNIWLYTKDITQKYNADNRLDFGVSKELVADAIKDFGVKLYQNNFSSKDLYTGFLGLTPEGGTFPFPEMTGSLPVSTGMEFVDTLISASKDIIPMDDVNKSLYKRIYHNVPYLLKSKGTIAGLRALITSYGIPDTILRISEFGGKDKVNSNDYDYYFNNFNYALGVGPDPVNGNFVSSSFDFNSDFGATNDRPKTIEFRFKAEEITSNISPFGITNLSQSLLTLEYTTGGQFLDIVLEYSGSGLDSGSLVNSSGSYSGTIKDPNYQYGNLKLIPSTGAPNVSASISLPFFDGSWWSVKLDNDLSTNFTMSAGNSIYNGLDGTSIGYFDSVTKTASHAGYANNTKMYFATSSLYSGFSGSLQEIRCYKNVVSESIFKDYIMNPLSAEGNTINSSPDQLMFRAALGSELDITSQTSIHPKVTGSWVATSSFSNNSNFHLYSTSSYHTNTETIFLDQPAVGIKNRITDKVRFENNIIPSGDTLSPFRRVTQQTEVSASSTENINYLEVAFSPQNQINDDIISQIGYFNVGDYIGDPRQRFSGNLYPDLNALSEEYFKKYIKQYDLVDFVRLIKFFDNSLFKMIKDFIPVRTSLASGLVVKQHLLERNKYPQPTVHRDEILLTGSINIGTIEGGPGGIFNQFNGLATSPVGTKGLGPDNEFDVTQSFSVTTPSLTGSINTIHDSQDEFYNGEFSGSTLLVSNGELNEGCEQFKSVNTTAVTYQIRSYNSLNYDFNSFINPENLPFDGYIQVWFQDSSSPGLPLPNPSIPSSIS